MLPGMWALHHLAPHPGHWASKCALLLSSRTPCSLAGPGQSRALALVTAQVPDPADCTSAAEYPLQRVVSDLAGLPPPLLQYSTRAAWSKTPL